MVSIKVQIEDKGLDLLLLINNRKTEYPCMYNADTEILESENINIISGILGDIIIENLQIRHLVKLLKQDYCFLSEKEQCDILVRVLKKLWYGADGNRNDLNAIKKDVQKRLYDILNDGIEEIVLEGFMRFRMRNYLEVWEKELQLSVEDYIRQKEYDEFIEILRLFVKIRVPREQQVHIIADLTINDYLITNGNLMKLKIKFVGVETNKEDALLSALVNIAPTKIVIHNKDRFWDAKILETIKDVFENRVEFSEEII
jgi:putative sporulation protein YtxC